ncbi:secretin N-terminal domain-containing protein [Comamonas testosteroni]|uniref:secretin N-terminal domain-containing protein n=1 Tax=Comamonas testosteroni TaxID=285 RepID=UPI0009BC68DD|nr:secretin N-terminal domain-containing protein [Comamonas testosteroni]
MTDRRRGWIAARVMACACVVSGCAAPTPYEEGQQLAREGNRRAAAEKLTEASRQEPHSARYRLETHNARDAVENDDREAAKTALKNGQPEQARAALGRALGAPRSATEASDRLYVLDVQEKHRALVNQARLALDKKEWDTARALVRQVQLESPNHPEAAILAQEIAKLEAGSRGGQRQALSQSYRKPISIEFKDTPLKSVFEVISRTSGINFLFDRDVKLDQKTSIYLRNSTIEAAVKLTLLTNQLEQQVLDANSVLIYPSTQAKTREYQPLKVRVFYLSNAEVKTVAATLKTILKTKDLVADEKLNMLVMRDTAEAIELAEKLVAAHDVAEPEVMLEVEVLEVNRIRLMELGIRWPEQLGLTPLGSNTSGLTLSELWRAAGDDSRIGASIGATTINARKVDTDGEVLANPRIRVRNRQKAKILIGDKVPNITSTSTATGFLAESINYVDVGLKLDVEPVVYVDGEVGMSIALEVSNLVEQIKTQAGSIAYRIGTRSAQTVLRLKDGENQILAGLINNEERTSANKVPGLGDLPLAGRLFGSQLNNATKTEIILSITPRIVRNIRKPAASMLEYDSGTEAFVGQYAPAPVALPGSASTPSKSASGVPAPATPSTPAAASPSPGATGTTGAPAGEEVATSTTARWLGPSKVKKGDMVAVQLAIDSPQPIVSLPVSVAFDPKAFQVISVTEGDFFKRTGGKSNFAQRVDSSGQVLMTGTLTGDGGVEGTGVLATFNLRALASSPAQSSLRITAIAPVGLKGSSVTTSPPPTHEFSVEP